MLVRLQEAIGRDRIADAIEETLRLDPPVVQSLRIPLGPREIGDLVDVGQLVGVGQADEDAATQTPRTASSAGKERVSAERVRRSRDALRQGVAA